MNKKYLIMFLALIFSLINVSSSQELSNFKIDPLDNMRILEKDKDHYGASFTEEESRDSKWINYLSASVKIGVPMTGNQEGSGSGTIVYYDKEKNLAYVATCGHLWQGTKTTNNDKKIPKCKIYVWYKNNIKLQSPKIYSGEVIFYISSTYDTALVTFKPDWEPNYFPIAPLSYKYTRGKTLHSLGCDGGRETAHYSVNVLGMEGNNLVTINNSPRPGRSGGGVIDNNYYVATCWGTQFENGSGKGYFTTLQSIHTFWKINGYEFLLNIDKNNYARKIKIIDRNSSQKKYSSDYIILP